MLTLAEMKEALDEIEMLAYALASHNRTAITVRMCCPCGAIVSHEDGRYNKNAVHEDDPPCRYIRVRDSLQRAIDETLKRMSAPEDECAAETMIVIGDVREPTRQELRDGAARHLLGRIAALAAGADTSDGEYGTRCLGCQEVYNARPSKERDGRVMPDVGGHWSDCIVGIALEQLR